MTEAHPRTTFQCECPPRAWLKPFSFLKQKGTQTKITFWVTFSNWVPPSPPILKGTRDADFWTPESRIARAGIGSLYYLFKRCHQWRSQFGGEGGTVPPWQRKICQNLWKRRKKSGERGENQEKEGKRGKKRKQRQKSGRFFHFTPPDR